jgi:hypothetical protein
MNETTIQELRARLRGELITPTDPTYESARKVYNAMIDRRPALSRDAGTAACPPEPIIGSFMRGARLSPIPSTSSWVISRSGSEFMTLASCR